MHPESPLFFLPLQAHPTQEWASGIQISVQGQWASDHTLSLQYRLVCDQEDAFVLPPPQAPGPADGLWRRTCCEAFVSACQSNGAPATPRQAYAEYNWSPSGQWAHYLFGAERQRDHFAAGWARGFAITSDAAPRQWALSCDVPLAALPSSPQAGWWLGLSVVLEHASGRCSHWALHHPAPTPDFHHPAARCLRLWPPHV